MSVAPKTEPLDRHLFQLARRPAVIMAKGQGSWLFDEAGKRYLDFIQGWAVNSLGHAPEVITRALAEQSSQLLTASPAFYNRPQLELSQVLATLTGLPRVFLTNSGAEANDLAIKLVRKWGQKHKHGAFGIITTRDSFHGRTLATVAASGKPGWDTAFAPNLAGFSKVPYADLDAVANALTPETCAVMVEPIQGEAGVVVPPPGYLAGLRALTKRAGILLVLDEIQTGCGRTGTFLRAEAEGVSPDILTLGKGLGGGVPIAALLAQEHAACFEAGDHGGTYVGNPLMAACSLAVLGVVAEPEFLRRVGQQGARLRQGLEQLASKPQGKCISEVRGAGLLWALKLTDDRAEAVRDACFELGLLVNAARPNVLRLMPELSVPDSAIDEALTTLALAFERCDAKSP